jgi:hypothetical protein
MSARQDQVLHTLVTHPCERRRTRRRFGARSFAACLAFEQARERFADRLLPRVALAQDLACDTVARREREQQVLAVGTTLRAHSLRLLHRTLEHALGPRRDPERP